MLLRQNPVGENRLVVHIAVHETHLDQDAVAVAATNREIVTVLVERFRVPLKHEPDLARVAPGLQGSDVQLEAYGTRPGFAGYQPAVVRRPEQDS